MEYEYFKNKLKEELEDNSQFHQRFFSRMIFQPETYASLFRYKSVNVRLEEIFRKNLELQFMDFIDKTLIELLQIGGYELIELFDADRTINYFKSQNNEIYMIDFRMREDSGVFSKKFIYEKAIESANKFKKDHGVSKINMIIFYSAENSKLSDGEVFKIFKNNQSKDEITYLYGKQLFTVLGLEKSWDNFIKNLETLKSDDYYIESQKMPNFNTDKEILNTLVDMPGRPWNRLVLENPENENDDKFHQLQLIKKELFKSGGNLDRAKKIRAKL